MAAGGQRHGGGRDAVVVNLANVVFVRVSRNDSETTGQYL
jgi:hypothetical protein